MSVLPTPKNPRTLPTMEPQRPAAARKDTPAFAGHPLFTLNEDKAKKHYLTDERVRRVANIKEMLTQDIVRRMYTYNEQDGRLYKFRTARRRKTITHYGKDGMPRMKKVDAETASRPVSREAPNHSSRVIRTMGSSLMESHLVWLYHHGSFPSGHVEPIDGDHLNTRIENLRIKGLTGEGKASGLPRGVTKIGSRYRAMVLVNNMSLYICTRQTVQEASKIVEWARELMRGTTDPEKRSLIYRKIKAKEIPIPDFEV